MSTVGSAAPAARAAVSSLVAALGLSGCGMLAAFPAIEAESSRTTCSDGEDNDLDGRVDCLDDSCFGLSVCDEDSLQPLCFDDADNDEDGLADEFDPACWEFFDSGIRRCTSVSGTRVDALSDTSDLWTNVRVESEGVAPVLRLPSDGSAARLALPSTGDGAEVEHAIQFGVTGPGAFRLRLESVNEAPSLEVEATLMGDGTGSLDFTARGATSSEGFVGARPEGEAWALRLVRADDRGPEAAPWLAELARGSRTVAKVEPRDVVAPLGPAPAWELVVSWRATDGRAEATLRGLSIRREPHHPCATPVGLTGGSRDAVIHGFSASDEAFCVLLERDDRAIRSLRAERAFRLGRELQPVPIFHEGGLLDPRPSGDAARLGRLAWTPRDGGRFVGVLERTRSGDPRADLEIFESLDCESWVFGGSPFVEGEVSRGRLVGYAVEDFSALHRIFTLDRSGPAPAIRRWISESGRPGTFMPEESVVAENQPASRTRPPAYGVTVFGGHMSRVSTDDLGLLVATNRGGGLGVLLSPSRRLNSAERFAIVQGRIWMEPLDEQLAWAPRSWAGVIAYTARPCETCPARFSYAIFNPVPRQDLRLEPVRRFRDLALSGSLARPY